MGFTDFISEILGTLFIAFMAMLLFGWKGLVAVAILLFIYFKWFRKKSHSGFGHRHWERKNRRF